MPLSAREPFSGNRSHYKCGQFFRSWNKNVYIKLQKLNRKVILFSKQQRIRATDSFPIVLAKFKIMGVFFSANPKTTSSPGRFFLALERSPHRCHSVLGIPIPISLAFWASPSQIASPQTSFGVRLSRIHLSVGEKWMRDKRTPKDVCGEATSQITAAFWASPGTLPGCPNP